MTIGQAIGYFAVSVMYIGLSITIAQTIYYGALFIPVNIASFCILLLGCTIALFNEECGWEDDQ